MVSQPGRGRDGEDDFLSADPPPTSDPAFSDPAFSEEGMRRIIYGDDRREGRARDSRSDAFAEDTAELAAGLRGRRSLVPIVTALAAVFCFGAIVWYAYTWGTGRMSGDELPVVRAQPMPEKVRPEQPGGMDVPHQGIAVLNNGSDGNPQESVERLLPRPEAPEPPPPAPPLPPAPSQAQTAPAQSVPPQTAPSQAAPTASAPQTAEAAPETTQPPAPPEAPLVADNGIPMPVRKPEVPKSAEAQQGDSIAALLQQEPIETANGKAEAADATPPAATQTAALAPGDVVLQLSSVASEAAAGQEWKRLQAAFPELLGKWALSVETADVNGKTYYRVQTGPFASRDAAAALCTKLKARNQDCLVKQR